MEQPNNLTKEQQAELIAKSLKHCLPQLGAVSQRFLEIYPLETTDQAVLDAITVPVPYQAFIQMLALSMLVVGGIKE